MIATNAAGFEDGFSQLLFQSLRLYMPKEQKWLQSISRIQSL
jgi:hypothetical protein